uniref:Adaptor protein Cbl EF hand-like domain-containing protein n=1 Tax=viral metagenome TaxID=1070528 RepID=A0A6C0JCZ6_9ZZZZ
MVDIISNINTCISTGLTVINVISETKNLKKKYGTICNDIILINKLLSEIKEYKRLTEDPLIIKSIYILINNLDNIKKNIECSKNNNIAKRFMKVIFNDIEDKKDEINIILNRIKIMIEIHKNKKLNSRFDIMNLFKINEDTDTDSEQYQRECVNFWEKHFGSENCRVNSDIFVNHLEVECECKLRKQEIDVLKKLIDTDCNGYVTIYEAYFFFTRFGPIKNSRSTILTRAVDSVYDRKNDRIYNWYMGDIFSEKVIHYLYDKGFGTCIIRNEFFSTKREVKNTEKNVFYIVFNAYSFSNRENTFLQIPIRMVNGLYGLQGTSIEQPLKVLDHEGNRFIQKYSSLYEELVIEQKYIRDNYENKVKECLNHHKPVIHNIVNIENKMLCFPNLKELYDFVLCSLKTFAERYKIIYYPYNELDDIDLGTFIQGECINMYSKFNKKWFNLMTGRHPWIKRGEYARREPKKRNSNPFDFCSDR